MIDIHAVSVPALAYLGDCVIELCVRKYLVTEQGLSTSAHLNAAALDFVRAPAQAEAMQRILPLLTEEEAAYFRRGRNMGHSSVPKRSTVSQYRAARLAAVFFHGGVMPFFSSLAQPAHGGRCAVI